MNQQDRERAAELRQLSRLRDAYQEHGVTNPKAWDVLADRFSNIGAAHSETDCRRVARNYEKPTR